MLYKVFRFGATCFTNACTHGTPLCSAVKPVHQTGVDTTKPLPAMILGAAVTNRVDPTAVHPVHGQLPDCCGLPFLPSLHHGEAALCLYFVCAFGKSPG